MAQYISKKTLVAKIEERLKYNHERVYLDRSPSMAGREEEDKDILILLDTLEVKEVDLDTEIMKYQREIYDRDTTVRDVAKYFFELGLKAQKGE